MIKQEIKNILNQYIKDTDHLFTVLDKWQGKLESIEKSGLYLGGPLGSRTPNLIQDLMSMKVILNRVYPTVNVLTKSLNEERSMNVKMKPLLKENRIYFVPLNKLIEIVEDSNNNLVKVFDKLASYVQNSRYYEGKEYEFEIKKVLEYINSAIASNNQLMSQTNYTIKKTK